ncbi:MAG: ABC transporter, partial [bacterium]|nr:ABC transporter [bacterium]
LHTPKVLFLDEPTIGLDVVMQKNLRQFIKEYNKEYKATIILTSHYMGDVEELCKRIIVIDLGKVIYDGTLEDVIKKYSKNKLLTIVFQKPVDLQKLSQFGEIKEHDSLKVRIAVPIEKAQQVAAKLLVNYPIEDLNIEDPDIETIIRHIFSKT